MTRLPALLTTLLALLAAPSSAAPPHQHGVARAEITVDPGHVTVLLQLPLDSAAGFERAPRSDAERAALANARTRLRDAAALVGIDPAAGCTLADSHLLPPAPADADAAAEAHADAEAGFDFDCRDTAGAAWLELRLFDAFARLDRVEITLFAPAPQARTLQRPQTRLPLR